jgi:PAS domain S-box-containing protein
MKTVDDHCKSGNEFPNAQMTLILENITDNVAVVDQDWRFVYVNERAGAIFPPGFALSRKDLWAAFPGLSEHAFGELYRQCMADRTIRCADGYFAPLTNWFSVRAVPVSNGLMILFRVITLERQKDLALKTSEARLQSIFDSLVQGIVIHDRDGSIVDLNPAAEDILGIAKAEARGLTSDSTLWQAVDAEGRGLPGEAHPAMIALRTGKIVRDFVMGIYNPARKERRWISVDACPVWELEGEPTSHAYAIFSDVTERRDADYDLRQSRLFMSVVQRVTSIGSAAIDFRTGKWNWSDETYRIYGVDRANFTPSRNALGSLVHPEDRDTLLAAPNLARQGITPEPIEYRIMRPDGAERILRREAALILDQDSQVTGIVGSVQDVTEIRAAERERELLQAQLNHAQRLDALGTLAGGIAHDLNNTLVPVVALSQAIENSLPEGDERQPLIELIRKGGERARDLVGQVLAFTRRENPVSQVVDLSEFLRTTMGLIRASIPTSIEIIEDLSSVRAVEADPSQLHQVLINLFANAAQAIGDRSGRIQLSLREVTAKMIDKPISSADSYALMSVTDTGCGMDESVQARIFEPFFTTKRAGAGIGLGLAVAQGIVEAHGGRIFVFSQPEQGARFEVYLPIAH